jgi:hypothetical protein
LTPWKTCVPLVKKKSPDDLKIRIFKQYLMKKLIVVVVVVVVVCGILWHWLVLVTIQPGLFVEKKKC